MQNIYCGNEEIKDGRGHFLGRVNGPALEIYCYGCKAFHRVLIADLVGSMAIDLQNGHDPDAERQAASQTRYR